MVPDRQPLSVPALAPAHPPTPGTFVSASSRGPRAFYMLLGGASFAHSFQGSLKDDPVCAAADSSPSLSPEPYRHAPQTGLSSVSPLVPTELSMVQAAGWGTWGGGGIGKSQSLLGTAPKAELEHCLRIARTFYFGSSAQAQDRQLAFSGFIEFSINVSKEMIQSWVMP